MIGRNFPNLDLAALEVEVHLVGFGHHLNTSFGFVFQNILKIVNKT